MLQRIVTKNKYFQQMERSQGKRERYGTEKGMEHQIQMGMENHHRKKARGLAVLCNLEKMDNKVLVTRMMNKLMMRKKVNNI